LVVDAQKTVGQRVGLNVLQPVVLVLLLLGPGQSVRAAQQLVGRELILAQLVAPLLAILVSHFPEGIFKLIDVVLYFGRQPSFILRVVELDGLNLVGQLQDLVSAIVLLIMYEVFAEVPGYHWAVQHSRQVMYHFEDTLINLELKLSLEARILAKYASDLLILQLLGIVQPTVSAWLLSFPFLLCSLCTRLPVLDQIRGEPPSYEMFFLLVPLEAQLFVHAGHDLIHFRLTIFWRPSVRCLSLSELICEIIVGPIVLLGLVILLVGYDKEVFVSAMDALVVLLLDLE